LRKQFFKNAFWLAVAEASTRGIAFLVFIGMARHFGPDLYGKWAFALNFTGLFAILTDFGFSALAVRELARDKSKTQKYLDNILAMKFVLGLITLGLAAFIIQFLSQEAEVKNLVYFLSLYIVINNFGLFLSSIFRANEKMHFETICRALQGLILLILSAFFVLSNKPILTLSWAFIAGSLAGVLFSLFFIWRYFSNFFLKIDWAACKEILKEAWPFLFSGIFYMIYFSVSSVMLGIFSDMKQVGYYNVAYSLFAAIFVLPGIITMSFYPGLSDSFEKNKLKFKETFFNFRKILVIIGFLLSISLFFLSKFIIIRVYSLGYSSSIILLKILSAVVLFKFLSYAYGWFLTSSDEQKKVLIVQSAGTMLNIVLGYFLILKYDALGAAIATSSTELFLFVFYYLFFKLKWKEIFRKNLLSA